MPYEYYYYNDFFLIIRSFRARPKQLSEAQLLHDKPKTKMNMPIRNPLSKAAYFLLQRFEATNYDEIYLEHTTFKYIYWYKKTRKEHSRLSIALEDFGYTKDQLDANSLSDIVSELLGRGIWVCQATKDVFEYHVYTFKFCPHINSCRDVLVTPTDTKGTKWTYVWREIVTGDLIWNPKENRVLIASSAKHLRRIEKRKKVYKLRHLLFFQLSTRETLSLKKFINY